MNHCLSALIASLEDEARTAKADQAAATHGAGAPRTDAQKIVIHGYQFSWAVPADFARQLERELNDLKSAYAASIFRLQELGEKTVSIENPPQAQLAHAEADRDAAREELKEANRLNDAVVENQRAEIERLLLRPDNLVAEKLRIANIELQRLGQTVGELTSQRDASRADVAELVKELSSLARWIDLNAGIEGAQTRLVATTNLLAKHAARRTTDREKEDGAP